MKTAENMYYASQFISLYDFETQVANKAEAPFAVNMNELRNLALFLRANEISHGIVFEEAHQRIVLSRKSLSCMYTMTLRAPHDRRFLVIIYDNIEHDHDAQITATLEAIRGDFNDVQSETLYPIFSHPMGLLQPYDAIAYVIPEAVCYAYLCESGKQFFSSLENLNHPEINKIIQQYCDPIKIALDIKNVRKDI